MPYSLLDRPDIGLVLFHPRPEYPHPSEDARARTVRFALPDGVMLGGRLYPAAATAPAILYFHGNGEIASDYDDLAPLYNRVGLTLLVVDYRGYGISTGSPLASTLTADAQAVFELVPSVLAAHSLTPSRLLVMGRSLGSAPALALAAASQAKLSGLIIESGFAETVALVRRLGGILPIDANESRDGFGNLDHIQAVTLPTLVIHGEDDWIIPFSDGRRLFDTSAAPHKRLLAIPGAGHNDLMMVGVDQYFPAIAALAKAP